MEEQIIIAAKQAFQYFLEVADRRRQCDFTFNSYKETSISSYYTDMCRYYFSAKYSDDIEYILVVSFYDKNYISDLFSEFDDIEAPDIVTLRLIEDNVKQRCGRLFSLYGPSPFNVITDISMNTEEFLNSDLADILIEDFLLG